MLLMYLINQNNSLFCIVVIILNILHFIWRHSYGLHKMLYLYK